MAPDRPRPRDRPVDRNRRTEQAHDHRQVPGIADQGTALADALQRRRQAAVPAIAILRARDRREPARKRVRLPQFRAGCWRAATSSHSPAQAQPAIADKRQQTRRVSAPTQTRARSAAGRSWLRLA